MQLDRNQLAERIEQTATLAFEGSRLTELLRASFTSMTKEAMRVFGGVGKDLGYQVAAAGYQGAWLYDMVWYTTDAAGMLLQLPMVLESELNPGGSVSKSADVDGDFQKLVQARAGVRVWLVACPNQKLARTHIANCKRQACLFAAATSGDAYVFIVYDWTTASTTVERFQVDVPGDVHFSN